VISTLSFHRNRLAGLVNGISTSVDRECGCGVAREQKPPANLAVCAGSSPALGTLPVDGPSAQDFNYAGDLPRTHRPESSPPGALLSHGEAQRGLIRASHACGGHSGLGYGCLRMLDCLGRSQRCSGANRCRLRAFRPRPHSPDPGAKPDTRRGRWARSSQTRTYQRANASWPIGREQFPAAQTDAPLPLAVWDSVTLFLRRVIENLKSTFEG
jgi:hypothetical protein